MWSKSVWIYQKDLSKSGRSEWYGGAIGCFVLEMSRQVGGSWTVLITLVSKIEESLQAGPDS